MDVDRYDMEIIKKNMVTERRHFIWDRSEKMKRKVNNDKKQDDVDMSKEEEKEEEEKDDQTSKPMHVYPSSLDSDSTISEQTDWTLFRKLRQLPRTQQLISSLI